MSQTLDYKTPAARLPLNPLAKASLVIGLIGCPACYILGALIADTHSRYPGNLAMFFLLAAEFAPPLLTILLCIAARQKMLPDSAHFRPSMRIAYTAIFCAFAWSVLPIAAIVFGGVNLC